MIPFPFLRRPDKEKYDFVWVFVKCKQTRKSYRSKKSFGVRYYYIENNMLIGKNGRISMEEFMKEIAFTWKNKERNSEYRVEHILGRFILGSRNNTIIAVSKDCAYFFNFYPLSIATFLNKKDFLRTMPCLLFDNEQYLGIEYL